MKHHEMTTEIKNISIIINKRGMFLHSYPSFWEIHTLSKCEKVRGEKT